MYSGRKGSADGSPSSTVPGRPHQGGKRARKLLGVGFPFLSEEGTTSVAHAAPCWGTRKAGERGMCGPPLKWAYPAWNASGEGASLGLPDVEGRSPRERRGLETPVVSEVNDVFSCRGWLGRPGSTATPPAALGLPACLANAGRTPPEE